MDALLNWLVMALITQVVLKLLKTLWEFIRSNKTRFLLEIVVGLLTGAIGYGINHLTSQATLQACQDERTELLRQAADKEAALAAVKYGGIIADLQTQLTQANDKLLLQRQKAASDSIRNMSELDAMRATNEYLRQYAGRAGIHSKR